MWHNNDFSSLMTSNILFGDLYNLQTLLKFKDDQELNLKVYKVWPKDSTRLCHIRVLWRRGTWVWRIKKLVVRLSWEVMFKTELPTVRGYDGRLDQAGLESFHRSSYIMVLRQ